MNAERRTAIWSPEAEADLSTIWDYHDRVPGRSAADNFVREIGIAAAEEG